MARLNLVIIALAAMMCNGCYFGPYMKRTSELNCPTDIRRTIPLSIGEDAVFRCPCRPACDFYGHKPTCWSDWPTPGTVWRDACCGPMHSGLRNDGEYVLSAPETVTPVEAHPNGDPTLEGAEASLPDLPPPAEVGPGGAGPSSSIRQLPPLGSAERPVTFYREASGVVFRESHQANPFAN